MTAFAWIRRRWWAVDPLLTIAMTLVIALAAARPAMADKRVALVIGNATYQHARGPEGAAGDARVIGAALQSAGFTLAGGAVQIDLDKASLDRAIQDFGKQISDADVALVYYAGHAIQLRASNFLVPVDADPSKESDVDTQMLHVGLLLHQLEGSARRLNVVVLDACHDNPFQSRGLTEPGLAAMRAPEGTLVSYPAQPDAAVPGTSDANNLFAMTLAETMLRPGLGLLDVFNESGLAVKRKTNGAQQPFVSFSPINAHFLFVAAPPPTARAAIAALPAAPKTATGTSERAVLYDEDPSDPKGRQYAGTAVWRIEQVKANGTEKAGVALRADVEIPDRHLKMVLTLRRNSDSSLPASHVAELTFIVPPDFVGAGIDNVPGMLMKTSEQARGTPIAGLSVRVKEDFFLVGFSNVESDRQRNMELLKSREWFDVPLVYGNKRRAILAIDKGPSGDRAFADALAAWDRGQ
ncbi:caspase domain-containing protein [Bradyrhizobium sp. STM 3557]|uniref:caspase family protein n=1 Tax=Bradyrhizobium sp. STM 3557 TaxID=578920 RepID=UPI00388FCFA9